MVRTRSFSPRRPRPRAVWAALTTGVVASGLVFLAVLLPVLGLIGTADATTLGALDVPVGSIVLAILITGVVGLALLVVAATTRNGAVAWVAAIGAIVATLIGSLWPIVATAFASVSQAQEIVPFIADLIEQVTSRL